jgi:predicted metal-binding membrane protein
VTERAACPPAIRVVLRRREIIMYPNSALSAGQLTIMAVVVAVSLAAWLILVFLAARQPHGTSAAVNAGPREEETAANLTQLPSSAMPADKTAA